MAVAGKKAAKKKVVEGEKILTDGLKAMGVNPDNVVNIITELGRADDPIAGLVEPTGETIDEKAARFFWDIIYKSTEFGDVTPDFFFEKGEYFKYDAFVETEGDALAALRLFAMMVTTDIELAGAPKPGKKGTGTWRYLANMEKKSNLPGFMEAVKFAYWAHEQREAGKMDDEQLMAIGMIGKKIYGATWGYAAEFAGRLRVMKSGNYMLTSEDCFASWKALKKAGLPRIQKIEKVVPVPAKKEKIEKMVAEKTTEFDDATEIKEYVKDRVMDKKLEDYVDVIARVIEKMVYWMMKGVGVTAIYGGAVGKDEDPYISGENDVVGGKVIITCYGFNPAYFKMAKAANTIVGVLAERRATVKGDAVMVTASMMNEIKKALATV